MKTPHKHAELIKAWADGAEIEYFDKFIKRWVTSVGNSPSWISDTEYRIKPEPKPDAHLYFIAANYGFDYNPPKIFCTADNGSNLKLTFDGETGKLKSAEIL